MDKKELEKAKDINKHQLGSIDLSDIEEAENTLLTDVEMMELASQAETFYKQHFKKVLKLLTQKQLQFIGEQAQGDAQLMFGRGTINGIYLIDEWFNQKISESMSRFQKEEKPELGEL